MLLYILLFVIIIMLIMYNDYWLCWNDEIKGKENVYRVMLVFLRRGGY